MVLFKRRLEEHLGRPLEASELLSQAARDFARAITVCCATDGSSISHMRRVDNDSSVELHGCIPFLPARAS